MLTVTDAATERLAALLDKIKAPEGVAARIVLQEDDSISMQRGQEEPGDSVFKHDDRVVLLLDETTAQAMSDQILDAFDTEEGLGLSLRTLSIQ